MEIKSFESGNFAGLKDVNIEFKPGLNVVLGPNESGKSTMVEGIFSTLFVEPKVRLSTKTGKDFYFRFLPQPGGDFIDGNLTFSTSEGEYRLTKAWGSDQRAELTGPHGIRVRNEEDIRTILDGLLIYGEKAYENLVFAKQRDLKDALSRILSDGELTKEIKDVLHMALMELSGISVDEIESKLRAEIDRYYSRWDMEKNHPEKNKGISDPWVNNLGLIIESYYHKEKLKLKMDMAQSAELIFEKFSNEYKVQEEEYKALDKEKQSLEDLEDSVNQRAIIGLKLEGLAAEEKALFEANEDWPKIEVQLMQDEEKLKTIGQQKEAIQIKQEKLKKHEAGRELKSKLKKLDEISEIKKAKELELSALAQVEQSHVEKLAELNKVLYKLEAGLKGRDMTAHIKSTGEKPIFITKDIEDKVLLEEGGGDKEITAGGYFKIEYGEELEIEVKASALDVEQVKSRYEESREKLRELLGELKLGSEEEVREVLEKRKKIAGDLDLLSKEEAMVLKDLSREDMERALEEADKNQVLESSEELAAALSEIGETEIDLKSKIKSSMDRTSGWLQKYESKSKLLILLAEKLNDKKALEKALKDLTPLPEDFKNPEEFHSRLKEVKAALGTGSEKLTELREEYYQAKANLMEESFEEYRQAYADALEDFERKLQRGEKFRIIEKAFYETKDKMTQNPMEALVVDFSRLLEQLTLGRYKRGEMDEDFNMSLKIPGGEIPLELLSSGTYDAVTLALRFALMRHFFREGDSFMVLDDCLVDIDPERKKAAAQLIQEFAKKYQIIFTTCHPETAKLLGGNLINMQ